MRRTLFGTLLLVTLLPVGAGAQSGSRASVSMDHFAFTPEELSVPVGTTVTWTYDDNADDPQPNCESPQFRANDSCPGHSTTAKDNGPDGRPLWDSGVHRAEGFPFSHTFTKPGRYEYYCIVHGGKDPNNPVTAMNGVIVVAAQAGGPGGGSPPSDSGGSAQGGGDGSAADTGAGGGTGAGEGAGAGAGGAASEGGYAGGVVPVTGGNGWSAVGVVLMALAVLIRGRRRLDTAV